MPSHFCITLRFLQPFCYGRGDGDEPEWPPSPLRVFQSLVAAAAAKWNERTRLDYAVPALEWLARQPSPSVIGAVGVASSVKYRTFVPDNTGDLAAGAWSRGDTTRIVKRTEKDVRPTHLIGDAVHYLYPMADSDPEFIKHKETLVTAARSITHLGWGIDMVAGNASEISAEEALKLTGEHWRPTASPSATQLRVPREGTLKALMEKHTAFLNRLSDGGFKPVPPLTAFDTVSYKRDTDSSSRPFVAFSILKADASGNRSFDTPRRCRDVAAWVRHATGEACKDWPDCDSFVIAWNPFAAC
jgi:CRISPR-associated protein Csb2